MRKSTKMLKKVIPLFLVVLLSFESIAAVVGDSDGPSFITKAEFEALKYDFNSQIDNYNNSLANKIDGVIAAYLEGIKVENKVKVTTGFDLVGKTNKQIVFLGRTNSGWNFSNVPYARDKIVLFANGGYTAGPDHFVHDSYDNWVWTGSSDTGNTSNTFLLIDSKRCVDKVYYNCAMYVNRFYAFYSTTNAQDGITWDTIRVYLDHPTALLSSSSANINDSTAAYGRGHSRVAIGSSRATYTVNIDAYVFSEGNLATGNYTARDGPYEGGTPPLQCVVTPLELKTRTNLQQQLSILMSKNERNYGIHICYQPTTKIRTSNQEWDQLAMVTKKQTSRYDYDVSTQLEFESGYWSYKTRGLSTVEKKISGYGVRFNENLTGTDAKWTFNDIYYKELYKVWDDETKLKYTGGFPVFKAEKEGTFEFRIKSNKTTNIIFTTSQNTSMPASTADNVREFNYKTDSASSYTTGARWMQATASTNYDFQIELFKDEIIYLNIDSADGNVTVTQSGTPYFTSK